MSTLEGIDVLLRRLGDEMGESPDDLTIQISRAIDAVSGLLDLDSDHEEYSRGPASPELAQRVSAASAALDAFAARDRSASAEVTRRLEELLLRAVRSRQPEPVRDAAGSAPAACEAGTELATTLEEVDGMVRRICEATGESSDDLMSHVSNAVEAVSTLLDLEDLPGEVVEQAAPELGLRFEETKAALAAFAERDRSESAELTCKLEELLARAVRVRRPDAASSQETSVVPESDRAPGPGESLAATEPAPPVPERSPPAGDPGAVFDAVTQERLAILRELLAMSEPHFTPSPMPFAPLGHGCGGVDEILGGEPGASLRTLEDLADLGLLQRELFNLVHVCSGCSRCQINFREVCPRCSDFDVRLERMLHHFRCGYAGLESEFTHGVELHCPKCRVRLNQLGQDFERPHDTYVCNSCTCFFEEPSLEAQCLHCERQTSSSEVETARVYRYRPTPLTIRAVEQGRLTGLDVSQIMYDAHVHLATRDWFLMQAKRELLRLRRHGGAFSVAILHFEIDGEVYPIFREWSAGAIRTLAELLTNSLRPLDLVARLDGDRLGMLLVEADEEGTLAVERRLRKELDELTFRTRGGRELDPLWHASSWGDPDSPIEAVAAFLDGEESEA